MGRLRALLHAQPAHATRNATAQPDELQVARPRECNAQLFDFAPPNDPENDAEALAERVAIMMEGNGWTESTARREAQWHADRERAWRVFIANAGRILAATEGRRAALLDRYHIEAAARYSEATAATMAGSMRGWIEGNK